jgi:hypothetical protein
MLKHSFLVRLLLALPKALKLSKWNLLIPVVIVGIVGLIEEVSPLRLLAVLSIISAFWLTECIATVFQNL